MLLEGTLRAPHLTAGFWTKKEKNHLALKERGVWLFSGKYCCWVCKVASRSPAFRFYRSGYERF